jgi:hypothetical protein
VKTSFSNDCCPAPKKGIAKRQKLEELKYYHSFEFLFKKILKFFMYLFFFKTEKNRGEKSGRGTKRRGHRQKAKIGRTQGWSHRSYFRPFPEKFAEKYAQEKNIK